MISIEGVEKVIQNIRKLLPLQNPLYAYLHNNVLLNWEDKHFFKAVENASLIYHASAFLPESYYDHLITQGRISVNSIAEAEKDDAYRLSHQLVDHRHRVKILRNHLFWERKYSEHFTRRMNDLLIPLISSYLDQGLSHWQNPWKKEGLWAFFQYYTKYSFQSHEWFRFLQKRMDSYHDGSDLHSILLQEFQYTGLKSEDLEAYLLELCFDLKGWVGMIHKLEVEPELAPIKPVRSALLDYLVIRSVAENALNEFLFAKHQLTRTDVLQTKEVHELAFSRNRILHEAFETSTRDEFVQKFRKRTQTPKKREGLQVLFCIDDREESLRRHLERIDPQIRTYGVVAFFGLDMVFHPVDRAKSTRQCPPVVEPQHEVYEVPSKNEKQSKQIDLRVKSLLSYFALRLYYQTRTAFTGFLHSLFLGMLSFFPLFFRVLFPNTVRKVNQYLNEYLKSRSHTELILDSPQGYSHQGMADIVQKILHYAGIQDHFSPVIVITSHGSTNKNNPFKQAYGCGACSGNAGHPNSRAFCMMANLPEVRAILKERRVRIPDGTVFIAAHHDTCSDEVTYPSLNLRDLKLNSVQTQLFEEFQTHVNQACRANALERCQYFEDIHLPKSKALASEHVKTRSMDLAQPRPEYGHARIAYTLLGRRDLSLGLNLEKRCFLVSYDPTLDADGSLLEEVSIGAVPVCANITLDYYFSRIDNDAYGAGSKLPLNITSLLGVMSGSKSDLRVGLGRQMVELHEPVRNHVFMEATEENIQKMIEKNRKIRNLVLNRWILLTRIDPESRELFFWNEQREWVRL